MRFHLSFNCYNLWNRMPVTNIYWSTNKNRWPENSCCDSWTVLRWAVTRNRLIHRCWWVLSCWWINPFLLPAGEGRERRLHVMFNRFQANIKCNKRKCLEACVEQTFDRFFLLTVNGLLLLPLPSLLQCYPDLAWTVCCCLFISFHASSLDKRCNK